MLLVDPATHEPSATAPAVLLTAATGEHELRREQVETGTAPLHTLSELRSSLIESRRQSVRGRPRPWPGAGGHGGGLAVTRRAAAHR